MDGSGQFMLLRQLLLLLLHQLPQQREGHGHLPILTGCQHRRVCFQQRSCRCRWCRLRC